MQLNNSQLTIGPQFSIFSVIAVAMLLSCNAKYVLQNHDGFPDIEDTFSKDISYQEKMTYTIDGVSVDNEFNAARLNYFEQINDSTFRATISPENSPINSSPYYSFRISSRLERSINLELFYEGHDHRYWPKLSRDGNTWELIDSNRFDTLKAPNIATLKLDLDSEKLYVSGQELYDSEKVRSWALETAKSLNTHYSVVGKSKLGRDMLFLDVYEGDRKNKDVIVVMSRQHPPEISGYMAMEAFVEQILNDNPLSNDFRKKFRVLVYPLINPDGVDLGHWRHNAGGIDLNRDWALYRQEEPRVIAQHIVNTVAEFKNNVVLGLDFHSTQEDLYYTLTDNLKSNIYNFKDYWLYGIDQAFPEYEPDDRPFDLSQPITKGWFYLQFGAEGITYEIGDETPRDFVREKARVAAEEMMKLLILK